MARVAYTTTSKPPTLRNAPPPEFEHENWRQWLERQNQPLKLAPTTRAGR